MPPLPSLSPSPSLQTVLEAFPPVHHAFAYGSSVFPQPGAEALRGAPPLVDFIFAVDDPLSWHEANLERNGAHYSLLLQAAGPAAVVALADSVGAGVHFNPFVRVGTQARLAVPRRSATAVSVPGPGAEIWRHPHQQPAQRPLPVGHAVRGGEDAEAGGHARRRHQGDRCRGRKPARGARVRAPPAAGVPCAARTLLRGC